MRRGGLVLVAAAVAATIGVQTSAFGQSGDGEYLGDDQYYRQPPAAEPDSKPPQTKFARKATRRVFRTDRRRKRVTFRFKATEGGSTFECKLDRKKWKPCLSPRKVRVRPGRHVFRVRATDAAGNTDATPAKRKFTVKRTKAKKRQRPGNRRR